jgi:hypothetical protein
MSITMCIVNCLAHNLHIGERAPLASSIAVSLLTQ